jgi:hypothetical protein
MKMELLLWTKFLNKRESAFYGNNYGYRRAYRLVATPFIEDDNNKWYEKLNLIEMSIRSLSEWYIVDQFCQQLNEEFKRLHFAYRIIEEKVVEITSEEEIVSVEKVLKENPNSIRIHLNEALKLYSQRPKGDYRNSIKESISAVEVFCREKTGEETLGKALKRLEASGIIIPNLLKQAFVNLYAYTNQPDTGIRHALMDDDDTYKPTDREAIFMIVTCSAFINYLNQNE